MLACTFYGTNCLTLCTCIAETKLLHKLAKQTMQGQQGTAGPVPIRQKLFGTRLQGFAAAEQQVQTAYSAGIKDSSAPARGLHSTETTDKHNRSNQRDTLQGSKRKDCMDHFVSKKPKLCSDSKKMPSKTAFDAAEKLMHDMCASEE